ncbi:hypothetical protein BGZ94_003763, partial [Podila epigama]
MTLPHNQLEDDIMTDKPSTTEKPTATATAKPKAPLTAQVLADLGKNKVIIVGAGLGGIMLGICLEKAGIPYEIFERAAVVKPL